VKKIIAIALIALVGCRMVSTDEMREQIKQEVAAAQGVNG
jgi:hypothetical protein